MEKDIVTVLCEFSDDMLVRTDKPEDSEGVVRVDTETILHCNNLVTSAKRYLRDQLDLLQEVVLAGEGISDLEDILDPDFCGDFSELEPDDLEVNDLPDDDEGLEAEFIQA